MIIFTKGSLNFKFFIFDFSINVDRGRNCLRGKLPKKKVSDGNADYEENILKA